MAAVEDIIATHPAGDVIVVAHGGVINAYFAHILKIRDQDMFFLPENTSLNTVVIRGDERLAWFLSDAIHLTDPGWFARGSPPTAMRRRQGLNGARLYSRETARRPQGSRSPCPSSSCPPNGPKR